ncbi:uncharacterized protein LOC144005356 [Festucalex cinctus]
MAAALAAILTRAAASRISGKLRSAATSQTAADAIDLQNAAVRARWRAGRGTTARARTALHAGAEKIQPTLVSAACSGSVSSSRKSASANWNRKPSVAERRRRYAAKARLEHLDGGLLLARLAPVAAIVVERPVGVIGKVVFVNRIFPDARRHPANSAPERAGLLPLRRWHPSVRPPGFSTPDGSPEDDDHVCRLRFLCLLCAGYPMASASLVAFVITSLLSVRSLQQTQVLPDNQSIPEQTSVRNLPEVSTGWYRASTHAPQVGKENASLPQDELTRVQDQLEKENVITEDDENFQEVEDFAPLGVACRADALAKLSMSVCASPFEQQMAPLEADARCVLDDVIGAYNQLSGCLESLSHWCGCYYPNAAVHAAFLRVHAAFFRRCPPQSEERHLEDAPLKLVLGLTLAPVALVPLLVYAVGRRSKVDK